MYYNDIRGFSDEVISEIKYYVYRLIDPRDGETFYVGKGKGNRVFQHMMGALKADEVDEVTDKLRVIREIITSGLEVIHVIHRHGMSEDTAFEVEAALMDAYPGSTNLMGGSGSNDFGAMNAKQIIEKYSAKSAVFRHKVIMIVINKSITMTSVYDATRFAWKINPVKANKADFIMAVSQGIIVDVFTSDEKGWREASIKNFPEFNLDRRGRYGFSGMQAPLEILNEYQRKRIPDEYRKKGAANPIKYNFA